MWMTFLWTFCASGSYHGNRRFLWRECESKSATSQLFFEVISIPVQRSLIYKMCSQLFSQWINPFYGCLIALITTLHLPILFKYMHFIWTVLYTGWTNRTNYGVFLCWETLIDMSFVDKCFDFWVPRSWGCCLGFAIDHAAVARC